MPQPTARDRGFPLQSARAMLLAQLRAYLLPPRMGPLEDGTTVAAESLIPRAASLPGRAVVAIAGTLTRSETVSASLHLSQIGIAHGSTQRLKLKLMLQFLQMMQRRDHAQKAQHRQPKRWQACWLSSARVPLHHHCHCHSRCSLRCCARAWSQHSNPLALAPVAVRLSALL